MIGSEIIKKVKNLNLPAGSFVVYGSGPLAILGIREANDIDLLAAEEVFEQLKRIGWSELKKGHNDTPVVYDVFEVHKNWNFSGYNPTLTHLLASAMVVEGVPIASLLEVKKWKLTSTRAKDMADVKLIDAYFDK